MEVASSRVVFFMVVLRVSWLDMLADRGENNAVVGSHSPAMVHGCFAMLEADALK